MKWLKPAFGAALLVAAITILVLVSGPSGDGETGVYSVRVDGPDGMIFNGTVDVDDATALTALLAAAANGDFDVDYSGSGAQAFVRTIDGHGNQGAGGWCYAVYRGEWFSPVNGAGAYPLEEGDQLWWNYYPNGCPSF